MKGARNSFKIILLSIFPLVLILTITASCDNRSTSTFPSKPQFDNNDKNPENNELKSESSNASYIRSRPKLIPIDLTHRIKSVNDSSVLPFDVIEKYGLTQVDFGLLDMNADGYNDLILEYYRPSGVGEKNRVDIYFYDHHRNKFLTEAFSLDNPSYYQDERITSYYYGSGGGYACTYILSAKGVTTTEKIEIDITSLKNGIQVDFKISNPPFLDTLLTTDNCVCLPKEYSFSSLFKRE